MVSLIQLTQLAQQAEERLRAEYERLRSQELQAIEAQVQALIARFPEPIRSMWVPSVRVAREVSFGQWRQGRDHHPRILSEVERFLVLREEPAIRLRVLSMPFDEEENHLSLGAECILPRLDLPPELVRGNAFTLDLRAPSELLLEIIAEQTVPLLQKYIERKGFVEQARQRLEEEERERQARLEQQRQQEEERRQRSLAMLQRWQAEREQWLQRYARRRAEAERELLSRMYEVHQHYGWIPGVELVLYQLTWVAGVAEDGTPQCWTWWVTTAEPDQDGWFEIFPDRRRVRVVSPNGYAVERLVCACVRDLPSEFRVQRSVFVKVPPLREELEAAGYDLSLLPRWELSERDRSIIWEGEELRKEILLPTAEVRRWLQGREETEETEGAEE
jgi:Skp family chaperone for outer membrane proteins